MVEQIKDCKIISLYQKMPTNGLSGYLIEISYKPVEGNYFEFMFNKEEFNQLFNWIKIQKGLK